VIATGAFRQKGGFDFCPEPFYRAESGKIFSEKAFGEIWLGVPFTIFLGREIEVIEGARLPRKGNEFTLI